MRPAGLPIKFQAIMGAVSGIVSFIKKHPILFDIAKKANRFFKRRLVAFEFLVKGLTFKGNVARLQVLKESWNKSVHPKVAFVKQEVLALIYCCPSESTPAQIVFSSMKHTGPVGLFTKLHSEFHIVKTEPDDAECNTWKEIVTGSGISTIEELESLKHSPFRAGSRGNSRAPGEFSVACTSIDWSRYDIVISMDVSVPTRLVKEFPRTTWAYCISEPGGMPSYKRSHWAPIAGYDLFLNQMFRMRPFLNKWHEIEWPFNLQYYGCVHELVGLALDDSGKRTGIFVESHTASTLTDEQQHELSRLGELYFVSARTEDILKDLLRCKYFIRLGGRSLLGNAMVEAVAAGCLVLGDASEFVNRGLFLKEHHVSSFPELLRRMQSLNENPRLFGESASRQRILLDYLCFYRPVAELVHKAKTVQQARQGRNQE